MSNLNGDILYLIFKELELNEEFRSCLLVNKTWCQIIIPTLWKDPWKYLNKRKAKLFLNVIISHLSDEMRNNLIQRINSDLLILRSCKKPYFNYISYCRNLNLIEIERLINNITFRESSADISIIKNTILELFINKNTKISYLNIPYKFDIEIHLIPGAVRCFSELVSLRCSTGVNDKILTGLMGICKSIEKLQLYIEADKNNYGIIELIENSEKLLNIQLINNYSKIDQPFRKVLENSLIERANSIQSFTISKHPVTDILPSFVHLKSLELNDSNYNMSWDCKENLSLPLLQILKADNVPIDVLKNLIKNTNGSLIEIKINGEYHDVVINKEIIQIIYQNCPKLENLKLLLRNDNILELENLLKTCDSLNGLNIIFSVFDDCIDWDYLFGILVKFSPINLHKFKFFRFNKEPSLESLKSFFDNWSCPKLENLLKKCQSLNGSNIMFGVFDDYFDYFDRDYLFEILTKFSPINLFKYKFFRFNEESNTESLKSIFDNWKCRHPILLQFPKMKNMVKNTTCINLMEKYKLKGIIKKYNVSDETTFEDFEWNQKYFG
ncbi:hypothetical protein RclHR1_00010005 [Rhizophagus clarus]|uniref:F-box domain-containing protein n=1 Tax=Rhizophagus clarus TaxID=94130 RepID=A0A2Z6Q039_9GLOM|nr:hypothetical protein RclHR1_00010005 [Rhizophagus clarus]GES75205.1 hypothetical protein GLOIN_2v1761527 [Rhizophagus clarus]